MKLKHNLQPREVLNDIFYVNLTLNGIKMEKKDYGILKNLFICK